MRDIKTSAKDWLAELEAREREETGIRTLKVGYNRVFGYYIEVSKSFTDKVPYRYERKQTLVNGERYITDELKQLEEKILSAESNASALEDKIFAELKNLCFENLAKLQSDAQALSTLDCLLSLANVSVANKYVKPEINKKSSVSILKRADTPSSKRCSKEERTFQTIPCLTIPTTVR